MRISSCRMRRCEELDTQNQRHTQCELFPPPPFPELYLVSAQGKEDPESQGSLGLQCGHTACLTFNNAPSLTQMTLNFCGDHLMQRLWGEKNSLASSLPPREFLSTVEASISPRLPNYSYTAALTNTTAGGKKHPIADPQAIPRPTYRMLFATRISPQHKPLKDHIQITIL